MNNGDARRPCLLAVGRVCVQLSTGSLVHRAKNELAGSALEAPTCLRGMPVASAKVPVPKPVAIMVMLTCSNMRDGDVNLVCRAAEQVLVGRPNPSLRLSPISPVI